MTDMHQGTRNKILSFSAPPARRHLPTESSEALPSTELSVVLPQIVLSRLLEDHRSTLDDYAVVVQMVLAFLKELSELRPAPDTSALKPFDDDTLVLWQRSLDDALSRRHALDEAIRGLPVN